MTRDETKQLLMRISSVYPNWKPQAELKYVVETWWEYLSEYSYEEMKIALKAYVSTDTSGFAPSIGQLIGKFHEISKPRELSEMEAWALVRKALRSGAEEEFDKLPIPVQKAVGGASQIREWSMMDINSVDTVIQSNFMRTYRAVSKQERELSRVPSDVRRLVENAARMLECGKGRQKENQR